MELSVIVPTLNEEEELPSLLRMLAGQRGVEMELIVSDGGSDDRTPDIVRAFAETAPFPARFLPGSRGRGRQLNAGAAQAKGEFLLFLHADSLLTDPSALREAVLLLRRRLTGRGDSRAAGRFSLCFRGEEGEVWRVMEMKGGMNRPGCIHGDQGFLLHREFFREMGGFEEDLPVMEDTRLADRVLQEGEWLLFAAAIATSSRRFRREGRRSRQTLNAVLMALSHLERKDILRRLPPLYAAQRQAGSLELTPLFREIERDIRRLPLLPRLAFWYRAGAYVAANAWQLFFLLDARRQLRGQRALFLRPFDRISPLFRTPPLRLLAALLTRGWFAAACRKQEGQGSAAPPP